ncbi:MAG: flagellar basal body rod protein FlgC [Nitrospinaceae bacterium]|nr:flagellar basal body rod protein FlgC [Nitrospinaceae bacterium]NIR57455.1 flagellar basal body rod protein FlgC [Nitrospinaceae bacterium]NIS87922.1 flagellar basal body rod protein FlgC [Nitrospinaceae bacterium]NIT84790.1 flagellar basal body rod protein FlgC [Nitrospinaceae bacterium]NIU46966.1 flagellar basal body rod protein FlgC [Nitrospinaceae bacterium]
MDLMTSMKISASGLNVQRQRMEVISSNLANLETTRTPEGGPYRRKNLVVSAVPLENDFAAVLQSQLGESVLQSQVTQVVQDQKEPRVVFDPNHPDANASGYVSLPNIDTISEMVDLVTATRSFEANITAINAAKAMAMRAIELGR